MGFKQTNYMVASLGGTFEWLEQAGSTNSELSSRADAPHFSVIATGNQVAGRGRAGRVWQAEPGTSLAVSVLLRPTLTNNQNQLGWLPLLTGLAMSETVREILDVARDNPPVGLKWPNDVLIGERKVSGVLSELSGTGVVVGAGLNLTMTEAALPVETATSLTIEGAVLPTLPASRFDQVLALYLGKLASAYQRFSAANFDAERSGLRQAITQNCVTLGREVRAILPDQSELLGKATEIDETGRLVIRVKGELIPMAAGDVIHMRHN